VTDHDAERPARITPPPGLIPQTEPPDATPEPPAATRGRIDLPAGLADSGTVRMPAAPRPTPVAAPRPVAPDHAPAPPDRPRMPAFFPATPGMPAAPPTPPAAPPVPPVAPPAPPVAPPAPPAAEPAPPTASPATRLLALELPDGSRLPVTGRMLLGRDPGELDGWRGAERVRLADPGRSVSKTHAAIEPDQESLLVHDLASTNGTERVTAAGESAPVAPGHPQRVEVGDVLHLGSFRVLVLAVG